MHHDQQAINDTTDTVAALIAETAAAMGLNTNEVLSLADQAYETAYALAGLSLAAHENTPPELDAPTPGDLERLTRVLLDYTTIVAALENHLDYDLHTLTGSELQARARPYLDDETTRLVAAALKPFAAFGADRWDKDRVVRQRH